MTLPSLAAKKRPAHPSMMKRDTASAVFLASVLCVFVWSGWTPKDRLTWVLEVFPVIGAVPLLIATRRRFPLTTLAYGLIAVHAIILMIGGRYTYAEVPLFNWIRDAFHLSRNHYDRLGHFAQGFVPAIVAREVLLRRTPLRRGGWLFFLVTCVCLAISAAYELLEWTTAVTSGSAADAFLGTQGDPWDTQKDMLFAGIGALAAQLTLTRAHDRQIDALARNPQ
jgi:putative membrane protein